MIKRTVLDGEALMEKEVLELSEKDSKIFCFVYIIHACNPKVMAGTILRWLGELRIIMSSHFKKIEEVSQRKWEFCVD